MSTVELKHKWRVSRDAWYIRLYLFAWSVHSIADDEKVGPSETDINFCKLFWGFLLMPLAFLALKPPFHAIDTAVWLGRKVPRRKKQPPDDADLLKPYAPRPPQEPESKRSPHRVLTWVSEAFVRLSLRVQTIWLRVRRPVLWASFALAVLLGVAVVGALGWFVIVHFSDVLKGIGLATLALALAAGLVLGVMALDRLGFWQALGRTIKRVFTRSGRKVKGGALGFGGAMRVGFYAVKTNACPEIVLDGAQTAASSGEQQSTGSQA